MQHKSLKLFGGLLATALTVVSLIGCNGSTGPAGANGTAGSNGSNGTNGTNGANGTNASNTINLATLTPAEWAGLKPTATITGVTISGKPVVDFKVVDPNGFGMVGFGGFKAQSATALLASYPNVALSIAKLVPEDAVTKAPSHWVNYCVTTIPTVATPNPTVGNKPSTDNVGNLVDHGDGTYTYTFYRDITAVAGVVAGLTDSGNNLKADLGDVSYQPTLTHRVSLQVYGNARGTGTNTANAVQTVNGVPMVSPANTVYDFIPATGAVAVPGTDVTRNMIDTATCNACHGKLAVHGGGRVDVRYCVVCHTDQRKYGSAEATKVVNGSGVLAGYSGSTSKINNAAAGEMTAFIHRMHRGEGLALTGYNYANILFNEIRYPQDIRNCVNCHTATNAATVNGDNWMNKPSRLACGACHDSVNFATGVGHAFNQPLADDVRCSECHDAATTKVWHVPATPPDPTNAGLPAPAGIASNSHTNSSWVSGNPANLPLTDAANGIVGASVVTWNIKSVSISAGHPVITFQFIKDGTPVVFNDPAVKPEMMDNFVGGPNLYFAFAVPQDGIAAPADYNASINVNLRTLWSTQVAGTNGTLVPEAGGTGFYTATLTTKNVPAGATMFTGGVGYFYGVVTQAAILAGTGSTNSLPLTQTNVTGFPYGPATFQGGLSVPAPNAWKMASGQTARRAIVTNARCNTCHQELGIFTEGVFHAGQRNDAPTCTFCHLTNSVNSGWSINIKEAVHSLHASSLRTTPYTWQSQLDYSHLEYPGVLNNCEACHVPGSYDLSNSASASAIPKMLWTTIANGNMTLGTAATTVATGVTVTTTNQVLQSAATPIVAGNTVLSPFLLPGQNFTGTTYTLAQFPTSGLVQPAVVAAGVSTVNTIVAFGSGLSVNSGAAASTVTTQANVLTGAAKPSLAVGATYQPEGSTLVNSPITSACYACHDSAPARSHMEANGGALNVLRSSVVTNTAGVNVVPIVNNEQCMICHASGKVADITAMHMNF